jgi:hypothetical protein
MIITKKVKVILNASNVKYYENLGYVLPKIKSKYYK